ncbi:MAG: DUF4249 family protein [Bacteroidales bacterium]|nr:DUF4249 family protein [Bacteroidales bacterium]
MASRINHKLITFSLVCAYFLVSCSEEIDLYAPTKTTPVVYALLNPDSINQYIRVGQSFYYEGDNSMLGSPGLTKLNEEFDLYISYTDQDGSYQIVNFNPYAGFERDTGLFAIEELETYHAKLVINPTTNYKLYLVLHESDMIVYGELVSFDQPFQLIDPLPVFFRTINLYTSEDFYFRFPPVSQKAVYQSILTLRYLEVLETEVIEKTMDFELDITYGDGKEITFVESRVSGEYFLREVGRRLGSKPAIMRIPVAFDFRSTAAGEEMYYFIKSANQQFSFSAHATTTLDNALGIFSCLSQKTVRDIPLSIHTIDSLAYSQYTKNLGFVSNH